MMLKYRRGERKGVMAKKLVYICLRVLLLTAVWAAALKTFGVILDRSVDLTDVLTFVGAAFGGELLLLIIKRLFAKTKSNDEKGDTYDG